MTKSSGSRVKRREGTKVADRLKAQGTTTKGILTKAHHQVFGRSRKQPTFTPPFAENEYLTSPEVAEAPVYDQTVPNAEGKVVCFDCGKLLRAKKDGQPYAHKCSN
jgi:hypothetical protein